jgi:hypothetical protein
MKASWIIIILISFIIMAGCTKESTVQTNVTPHAYIDIPNGDFENWNENLLLVNWKTNSCPLCEPPFESYIVQKDTSTYHGKFAAKFIYNNVYAAWAENKFALSIHPVFLGAYVKCSLSETDTVSIKMLLFKNMTIVDSGVWFGNSLIPKYQYVYIEISHNSSQVDSGLIRITGGHKQGNLNKNTEFWVDFLNFEWPIRK